MLEPVRYYLANRQFQHSLLNYDVLELDDRAFDWSGSLKFRYEYHLGRTLSTEVFQRPPSPAAGLDYTSWLFLAIAEFHQFLETHGSAALDRFVGHARLLLDRTIFVDGWRALFGIHEFGRATGDREAWNIFDEGASTLCDEVLDTFDAGHATRYHQMTDRPGPASCLYTKVHARQLAVLHRLTGKPHFLSRAKRWQQYTMNPGGRLLLGVECLEYRIANAPRYARDLCRRWSAPQQNRAGLSYFHRV